MKLTTALLLLTCFQVSANVFSQTRITLQLQSTELKKVLSIIERKSSFRFLYNDETVKTGTKVDVQASNTPVTEVLDKLFAGRPLTYKILENNLVVITNSNTAITETRVTGKITSSIGEVLPGVTVSVKGSSLGTQTDASGNFSLTVPDNAVLVISYVGYVSQEIAVSGRTTINVTLVASTQKMDEVVVIGYGTATKRDLTGSIVKVLGKDIADKPNTNPISSLQSKVAGLSVVNDGRPGEDPDIRIRGTISIGSVHPLYVVDGILNDDIKFLNPNDIESIEVLKDPSSLAIFGVRGAAGVIIVTTKKARAGQVTVNVNSTWGAKQLVDAVKVADAAQFKLLLNEEANNRILDNAGDLGLRTFIDNHLSKWNGNTDWQKAVTRTAVFNTNNISVAGSSDKNRFYMGVGYTKDQGLVKHVELEKIQLSINDEYKINNFIKVGFNLNTSKEKLPYDANGLFSDARRIAPIVQPYYPDQGLYSVLPNIQQTLSNPLMVLENRYANNPKDRYRIVGSVFAEVNILKNLTARATWYGDWTNQRDVVYTPIYNGYNPDGANNQPTIDKVSVVTKVSDDRYDTKKWQQDYVLTYKKNFGAHNLTATYGFETYFKGYNKLHGQVEQKANGDPIPNDKRFWNVDNGFGDPSSKVSSSAQYEQATVSHLARILYSFQNKYYLNASFRRDGSYAFFKNGNTYDNFYAFGAAWNLAKEAFMVNQRFFNDFKIKGSWGLLGNQSTYDENNNYPLYPALLNNTSPVFGQFVYPAYSQAYLPFGDLHWEHVKALEAGFEFQALGNRLHFEALYYKKKTEGFLVQVPGIAGATGGLGNTGDIENKGFEFSGSWTQNFNKDLAVTVSGNLSTIKNKVLKLNDTGYKLAAGETNPNQTEAGYPIGYFYGFVVDGVYQNAQDLASMPVSLSGGVPTLGDLKFRDVNGDKKITDDDRTIIGNPTPKFTYGASVAITFKNFNLGVDMGGVSGNQIYRIWGTSENQFSLYNYAADKLNRWHGEGTSNFIPILNNGRKINRLPSTLGIESGSYFRIRNLQLGYNLPATLVNKVHIKSVRIFANVQNLKTFKKNAGYSPEFGGTGQQAAISFGLDNADAAGAIPRIITGGVNITF
ncbi:MAG TPA: TonB-dependent receptor [Chitinophagaceae bacterium]|nr:TonB-dependent receptor [Chitinophagaceae bacterium]